MKTGYLFHVLGWMLPVMAIQWLVGPRILWKNLRVIVIPSLIASVYFTVADSFAIKEGIWFFDPAQILGITLGPYAPVEEFIFFLFSAFLIVQSLVLFLPSRHRF